MYFPVFQGSLNIPRAVACFQQKMPTGLSFRTYAPRLIPVCYGHHWILVIDRTQLHISLMILDSLNREHRSIEVKITKYLQDVWSAKLPQSGKKTIELKQIRYPAKQQRLWFVHYGMLWTVPWLGQQKLTMVVVESRILTSRSTFLPQGNKAHYSGRNIQ